VQPQHKTIKNANGITPQSLNTIIRNGKLFMGYDIVKRLKGKNEITLLHQMREAVTAKDRERKTDGTTKPKTFGIGYFLISSLIMYFLKNCKFSCS